MHKDLVLGYDIGTSAVKAALFRRDGSLVASGAADYGLITPQPGWAEQAPQDWWQAMAQATRAAFAQTDAAPAQVAAMGMAAQMCGVVPVDAEGSALHNALIWLDTRSSAIARKLMGGWPQVNGYGVLALAQWLRLTGGAPNLSGKDSISKMLWLRQERPELWRHTAKLLDVKDYLLHRCTGRFATSYDCAHLSWLFDGRPGRQHWSDYLLRRTGLSRGMLPDIVAASDIAGRLSASAASALGLEQDTPVIAGMGDVSAAAASAGAPQYGSLHLYVGTSLWLGARLQRSRVDPLTSIGSITAADGRGYLLIATQESAGSAIAWGMEALGFAPGDFASFEAAASSAIAAPDCPMFFPWLAGERVPVDDEKVRGGFAGLSVDHDRASLARAVYEGVALNARWAMQAFDRLSGRKGQPLRILGGGARSALWCQIFADTLGRPIMQVENPVLCGALGAAMAAGVAAGWFADLDAASAMSRTTRSFTPSPAGMALADARFARYARFYRRARPWYHGR